MAWWRAVLWKGGEAHSAIAGPHSLTQRLFRRGWVSKSKIGTESGFVANKKPKKVKDAYKKLEEAKKKKIYGKREREKKKKEL